MKALTSLTAVVLSIAASPVLADDYPQPGLYKVVATVSSAQLPVGGSHNSEQCLKDDEFRSDPSAWMEQQQGQQCEVVDYTVAGGNIRMELKCAVPGSGASTIIGTGTYTNSSWQMQNVMRMNSGGMSMEITTNVSGTRQGNC